MTLDKIEKRIEALLTSDKRWPVIVDFSNKNDLKDFLYHFKVGSNEILSAGKFCGKDGTMKLEELSDRIDNNSENLFIVHISAYLKLDGESVLKNTLRSIISKSILLSSILNDGLYVRLQCVILTVPVTVKQIIPQDTSTLFYAIERSGRLFSAGSCDS